MSENEDTNSHAGFDAADYRPAYVYRPDNAHDDTTARPTKRRKLAKKNTSVPVTRKPLQSLHFEPLINGLESSDCVRRRQEIFEKSWSRTEVQIQSILDEANEDTLTEVTLFINGARQTGITGKVPTGFIVTGPNISSQELLFKQLSSRLKTDISGPVTILRSGDASNMKSVLKQLIRDATNQKSTADDEEGPSFEQDGRKLLSYDLEILHSSVKAHGSETVVVVFQDSEAFDTGVVGELIGLFSSWMDRIPFVLLFGIATSVELFHERLSRAASCCLFGAQFDVEQTGSLLERIFQKAVAGQRAPLRLGPLLVSALMERQQDHVQSVQSFIAALKYSYMCHYYGNALSVLNAAPGDSQLPSELLDPQHFQAIRMLPSFRNLIESLVDAGDVLHARALLEDDSALFEKVQKSLDSKDRAVLQLLRAIHIVGLSSSGLVDNIALYITGFDGTFGDSNFVRHALESIKHMAPDDLNSFIKSIRHALYDGVPEMELDSWASEELEFLGDITEIHRRVTALLDESSKTGKPVRSSYAIHSKGIRTTVIAQRVQLSYEKSTLSDQDKEFTSLVDRLSEVLGKYFNPAKPQDLFMSEIWLYDSTSPYRDVFTPRPRAAVERALSLPHNYLNCECCESVEALSSTQPATAILYQMYLETGSLINVFDLWSAFLEMISSGEEEKCDERDALVLFYRALGDLKVSGMVKQSKRKADHLAKAAWEGL